jgi:hypothetical protein
MTEQKTTAACGASLSDAELGRNSFEAWAEMQAYFGYEEGDQLLLERDGEGYTDSCVHAAWMSYLLQKERILRKVAEGLLCAHKAVLPSPNAEVTGRALKKILRFAFEKTIFILAVIALTILVVLTIDTIQATRDFATAPASALIAIVISCVLSMIRRWL